MSMLTHPLHWLAVFGVLAAVLLLMAVFRCRGGQVKVLLVVLALAALAPAALVVLVSYPDWVDPRFTAYRAFYEAIQPGMTRMEVLALRDRHYPPGGLRQAPRVIVDEGGALTFFMHPEDPESSVDCEGILLSLENDRVVKKTYSPD